MARAARCRVHRHLRDAQRLARDRAAGGPREAVGGLGCLQPAGWVAHLDVEEAMEGVKGLSCARVALVVAIVCHCNFFGGLGWRSSTICGDL